ncbi:MAG TPA: hypothetical protein PKC30_08880 [Saprospiraceae bacterium]|nr:hypothetical protein [Saprospiraceae bacterium]
MRKSAHPHMPLFSGLWMSIVWIIIHPIGLYCQKDTIPPACIIKHFVLKAESLENGAVAQFPVIAIDDQSDIHAVEFYHLRFGEVIMPGDYLECGFHPFQGLFVDQSGNITICEFDVWVRCGEDGLFNPADHESGPYPYHKDFSDIAIRNVNQFENHLLGSLSIIWESGKRGPGTISKGKGDPGGVSYGVYQISSKYGSLNDFFRNEGLEYSEHFKNLNPGTPAFNNKWKEIASKDGRNFRKAQHDFVERKYYLPFVEKIEEALHLNLDQYSEVLKDVVWSTAVQHGPFNNVFKYALGSANLSSLSEEEIIERVYRERSRTRNGILVHFPRVSQRWQNSLLQRFKGEKALAISRLQNLREAQRNDSWASQDVSGSEPEKFMASEENVEEYFMIPCQDIEHHFDELFSAVDMMVFPLYLDPSDNFFNYEYLFSEKLISTSQPKDQQIEHDVQSEEIQIHDAEDIHPVIEVWGDSIQNETEESSTSYRILFLVHHDPTLRFEALAFLGDISTITNLKAEMTQYFIGRYSSIVEARKTMLLMYEMGYKAAILAAFENENLIELGKL